MLIYSLMFLKLFEKKKNDWLIDVECIGSFYVRIDHVLGIWEISDF